MNIKIAFTISILLICMGLSGCLKASYHIRADKIDEGRGQGDFFLITEQQYELFPLTIKNAINNSGNQVNITIEDLQTLIDLLNGTSRNRHILEVLNQGDEYCTWWGYLSYQELIYRIRFCFMDLTDNFTIVQNLDDVAINISEQQMEQFPHLKESIINQTSIDTPIKEFNELYELLEIKNINHIKYQNEYYELDLAFGD